MSPDVFTMKGERCQVALPTSITGAVPYVAADPNKARRHYADICLGRSLFRAVLVLPCVISFPHLS